SERAFAGLTAFKPQDWEGQVTTDAVERAAATGAFGVRRDVLTRAFPRPPAHGRAERHRALPFCGSHGRGGDGPHRRWLWHRRMRTFGTPRSSVLGFEQAEPP